MHMRRALCTTERPNAKVQEFRCLGMPIMFYYRRSHGFYFRLVVATKCHRRLPLPSDPRLSTFIAPRCSASAHSRPDVAFLANPSLPRSPTLQCALSHRLASTGALAQPRATSSHHAAFLREQTALAIWWHHLARQPSRPLADQQSGPLRPVED